MSISKKWGFVVLVLWLGIIVAGCGGATPTSAPPPPSPPAAATHAPAGRRRIGRTGRTAAVSGNRWGDAGEDQLALTLLLRELADQGRRALLRDQHLVPRVPVRDSQVLDDLHRAIRSAITRVGRDRRASLLGGGVGRRRERDPGCRGEDRRRSRRAAQADRRSKQGG